MAYMLDIDGNVRQRQEMTGARIGRLHRGRGRVPEAVFVGCALSLRCLVRSRAWEQPILSGCPRRPGHRE